MLELHPEMLKKNGRTEFVVLPYEEFVQRQEIIAVFKQQGREVPAPHCLIEDLPVEAKILRLPETTHHD